MTIEAKTIERQVVEIIADEFSVDESEVTPNANLLLDFGADSLDVIELVMRAEETFEIEISDEDAARVKTVKDIVDLVTRLKR